MSRFDEIVQTADNMVEKYGTRNPTELADELEVIVLYKNFNEQKGVFTIVNDFPFIFITTT